MRSPRATRLRREREYTIDGAEKSTGRRDHENGRNTAAQGPKSAEDVANRARQAHPDVPEPDLNDRERPVRHVDPDDGSSGDRAERLAGLPDRPPRRAGDTARPAVRLEEKPGPRPRPGTSRQRAGPDRLHEAGPVHGDADRHRGRNHAPPARDREQHRVPRNLAARTRTGWRELPDGEHRPTSRWNRHSPTAVRYWST